MIAYILLCGRPPFRGRSKPEIFHSITSSDLVFDHPIWDQISEDAKDFIRLALTKDKNKRKNASDFLEHSWIRKQVKQQGLTEEVKLEIAHNLQDFRVTTL